MKKYFVFLMAAVVMMVTGCSSDDDVKATAVTLSKTETTVQVNRSELIIATVTPSDATEKVVWSSSAEGIARVDQFGEITGVSVGTATITATAGSVSATCVVTVVPFAEVSVTGVALEESDLTIETARKITLVVTIEPANASNKTVTWTSSQAGVATVVNGVVTGLSAGTTTITVTSAENSDFTATCEVTVTADFLVADFEDLAIGTQLGVLTGFAGGSNGEVTVALAPLDEDEVPEGAFTVRTGDGKAALIHGDTPNDGYGLIGTHIGPYLEVTLPAGKTLNNYKALLLDAYFVTGTGNGGTDPSGAGWFGWGPPFLRIEGPDITVEVDGEPVVRNWIQTNGFAGNIRNLGSFTIDPENPDIWAPYTWARGIELSFDDWSIHADYQSINTFRIGVGLPSGAIKAYMDNFVLVHK